MKLTVKPLMRAIPESEVIHMSENENATSHPIFTIEERQAMCNRLQAVREVISQNNAQIESLREEIAKIERESSILEGSLHRVERIYEIVYDSKIGTYRLLTEKDVANFD